MGLNSMKDRHISEGDFERFFNLTLEMQCIATASGYFQVVNQAFTDTLGWSFEDLVARPFMDFVHPDDQAATQSAMKTLVKERGNVVGFHNRYKHLDGSWRVLSWKALPEPNGSIYASARDVTEQIESVEALKRAQESLAVMLQSIGDAVIATDIQGNVILLNGIAEEMTGWTSADAIGLPISKVFQIIHEHSRKPAEIPVERVLRTGNIQGLANHTSLISRNGAEWHIADSASPIRGSDGQLLGVVMVFRDVAEDRRSRQTQEHLAAIVKSSKDAIISETVDGTILSWNPAAEAIFGFTAEEAIGHSSENRIPQDRWDEVNVLQNRSMTGDTIENFETVRARKDGSYIDVSITMSPIRDDAGLIVGVSKIFRDITEAKRAEVERNRERRLLDAILETVVDGILAMDGIIVMDEMGTILRANQSMLALFGYSLEEIVGRNVYTLIPTIVDKSAAVNVDTGVPIGITDLIGVGREAFGLRKDKSVFPLELSVGENKLEGSRLFTCMIRDISQRNLVRDQLLEAKKEAEQSNLAKSEFLSHMSHELRTPLNAVLGYAQLIKMRSPDPKSVESAQAIIKGGRLLLDLINEVLDLARIQAGTFSISLEPVNLTESINRTIELVHPLAQEKNITINVLSEPFRELYAMADSQRITQVMLNIIGNAIKYNRDGGRVEIRITEDEIGYYSIEISDTGQGISESDKTKLFIPFERLGQQLVDGTGLGLALSQDLIRLMGGKLELKSTSFAGSTFAVKIHSCQPVIASDDSSPGTHTPRSTPIHEQIRVLYIEDNISNVQLMKRTMESIGDVELFLAITARTGLELAESRIPDLILLDVHLPDENGDVVLQKLRANPKTASIPVVIISADATEKQIDHLMSLGAKTYLTKPLELSALFAEVDEARLRNS